MMCFAGRKGNGDDCMCGQSGGSALTEIGFGGSDFSSQRLLTFMPRFLSTLGQYLGRFLSVSYAAAAFGRGFFGDMS